eukprot:1160442-Pelagomonas_calceolata.AAC.13
MLEKRSMREMQCHMSVANELDGVVAVIVGCTQGTTECEEGSMREVYCHESVVAEDKLEGGL